MKREKNFYFFMIMLIFIISYIASFTLLNTKITLGNISASAAIFIYPLNYFIAILFCERYGKDNTFNMIMYAIFSIIALTLLITFTNLLPNVSNMVTIDYRILFSFLIAFLITQLLNIAIYYFLDNNKVVNFLISGAIALTVNAIIFIGLGFIGTMPFSDIVMLFAGELIISIIIIMIYSLIFANTIYPTIKAKEKEEIDLIIEEDKKINKTKSKTKSTKPIKKTTAK